MGIKLLNQFIKYNCKNTLSNVKFENLYGKTICIDTHIYMYKFCHELSVIEGMYLLCSLFKKYNITPIFVWDGKPPKEKWDEIDRRNKEKRKLSKEYDILREKYNRGNIMDENLSLKINKIKKQIVRINHVDIQNVKNLFDSYGIMHITADGEADKLCAELVIQKKAYACVSEDMDLFVYGCPRVLRYMNIRRESFCLYDFNKILKKINISFENFKVLCILCGTDYDKNSRSIFKLYKYYEKWEKQNATKTFLVWLNENYYNDLDLEELNKVYSLFDMETKTHLEITKSKIDKKKLYEVLKLDNFIFP